MKTKVYGMRINWLLSIGSSVLLSSLPLTAPTAEIENDSAVKSHRARFVSAQQNFEQVRQVLLKEHVGDSIDEEELYRAATEGMLRSLNQGKRPWNKLLSPYEYRELEFGLNGKFAGIGIEIEFVEQTGTAVIRSVLQESPAQEADLREGDQILSVNDKPFRGKSVKEIVDEIRGPAGEKVLIKYLRDDKISEQEVTRAVVSWAPVKAKTENNVGQLSIRYFNKDTPQMIAKELAKFHEQKVKGLVLDLRKNSGGVFGDAVETADYFLPKGKIITYVIGRNHHVQVVKSKRDPLTALPLVVLVDEATSSGAELVAASLKENLGTKVIGQRTFGKWNAQSVKQLPNRFAIKYTVYEFRSPKNKNYHDVGITPDVVIANPRIIESKKSADSPVGTLKAADKQLETAYHLLREMI